MQNPLIILHSFGNLCCYNSYLAIPTEHISNTDFCIYFIPFRLIKEFIISTVLLSFSYTELQRNCRARKKGAHTQQDICRQCHSKAQQGIYNLAKKQKQVMFYDSPSNISMVKVVHMIKYWFLLENPKPRLKLPYSKTFSQAIQGHTCKLLCGNVRTVELICHQANRPCICIKNRQPVCVPPAPMCAQNKAMFQQLWALGAAYTCYEKSRFSALILFPWASM